MPLSLEVAGSCCYSDFSEMSLSASTSCPCWHGGRWKALVGVLLPVGLGLKGHYEDQLVDLPQTASRSQRCVWNQRKAGTRIKLICERNDGQAG